MSRVKTTKKAACRKAFLPLERRLHKVTQNAHNAAPGHDQNRAPQALVGRPMKPMSPGAEPAARPTFLLRLEARPGVAPIRALRWLLKGLARQHGFRCLDVREDDKPQRRR